MRFEFADPGLEALYIVQADARRYSAAVVRRFFLVVHAIEGAADERDFYKLKSFHFDELEGKHEKLSHRSMRLNDQYRLIVMLEDRAEGRIVVIHAIEDYH